MRGFPCVQRVFYRLFTRDLICPQLTSFQPLQLYGFGVLSFQRIILPLSFIANSLPQYGFRSFEYPTSLTTTRVPSFIPTFIFRTTFFTKSLQRSNSLSCWQTLRAQPEDYNVLQELERCRQASSAQL